MSKPHRDPATQFQIGDVVVYLPEGIHTKVSGFMWTHIPMPDPANPPKIVAYVLAAGITTTIEHIAKPEPEKPAVEVVKAEPFEVKSDPADGMNRETRDRTGPYGEKL